MATPKERAVTSKSLILLLQALEGRTTTVELRNEIVVHGTVEKVDSCMNVDMANVTLTVPTSGDAASPVGCFEQFHIQGRQVRYVHVPDDVDMMAALKQKLEELQGSRGQSDSKPAGMLLLKTRQLREKILRRKEGSLLGRGRPRQP